MPRPSIPKAPCIALIGDMVKSRAVLRPERAPLQRRFQHLIGDLNHKYRKILLSKFVITLGDEFQGLLASALAIPDILWDLENKFADRELRVGIGFGVLYTPAPKLAINVDGPALHNARQAVINAKKSSALGGVFFGFDDGLDQMLNGIARILWFHRSRLTLPQHRTIDMLREGLSQSEVAKRLRVSRQAISKQANSAGWTEYKEAETSWRTILSNFVETRLKQRNQRDDQQ